MFGFEKRNRDNEKEKKKLKTKKQVKHEIKSFCCLLKEIRRESILKVI